MVYLRKGSLREIRETISSVFNLIDFSLVRMGRREMMFVT